MPIDHTRRGLLRGAGALFLCAPSSLVAIRGVLMGCDFNTDHLVISANERYLVAWIRYESYDRDGLEKTEWFGANGGFIKGVYRDPWYVANGQHS